MELGEYLDTKPRGEARRIAREIGENGANISLWKKGKKPIPIVKCVQIEKATNGAVTRKDLRPDDWAEIWPELVE